MQAVCKSVGYFQKKLLSQEMELNKTKTIELWQINRDCREGSNRFIWQKKDKSTCNSSVKHEDILHTMISPIRDDCGVYSPD